MDGKSGYRIFFIAGYENDMQIGLQVLELFCKGQTICTAHFDVQKRCVERLSPGLFQSA